MVLALDAVVMEMERGSASTGGTVTMEIPTPAAASVEQADPEESVQQRGQHHAGATIHRGNYRILIVIGEISSRHHLDTARKQIAQGLRSWNVDLTVCDLDKELQLFETRHTAQFSTQVKGRSSAFCALSVNVVYAVYFTWLLQLLSTQSYEQNIRRSIDANFMATDQAACVISAQICMGSNTHKAADTRSTSGLRGLRGLCRTVLLPKKNEQSPCSQTLDTLELQIICSSSSRH
ncbi:Electromotor neuron-associated protein 1 [Channa argus]|uniref:Electromotor neuron-associated protein 1 n=1 Tax=Channa argus TaxID=215402 RepID=A0A6G1P7J0_CHAAH|nr:Electromotor neuron-associated protein 1 [Channa argus]